jgi:CBS domain-containing protein
MATHQISRTIREVMTCRPTTVGEKTSVRTLRGLFIAYGFNAFPVVDEAGTLLGIVTKLDLLRVFRHDPRRLLPELRAISAEHVDDIMRRRVVTVAPDDQVTAAADSMLASRLRSLPVIERRSGRDRVVGIVSRGDVLRGLSFEPGDAE